MTAPTSFPLTDARNEMTGASALRAPSESTNDHSRKMSSASWVGIVAGAAAALTGVSLPGLPSTVNASLPVAALALVIACLASPRGRMVRFRLRALDAFLLLYVTAIALVEYFDVTYSDAAFSLSTILNLVGVLAVYFACRLVVTSANDGLRVLQGVFIAAIPVAVLGISQMLGGRQVSELLVRFTIAPGLQGRLDLGWPLRATSTLGHWTALGGYLAIAIAIGCYLIVEKSGSQLIPKPLVLGIGILFVAQVSTFTFAPILVAIVTMLYTAVQVKIRFIGLLSLVSIGGAAFLLFDEQVGDRLTSQLSSPSKDGLPRWIPETIRYRVGIWNNETVPAVLDSPLFGHGANVYNRISAGTAPSTLRWPSPESEWMRTAVASGVVLAVLEVALLVYAVSKVWTTSDLPGVTSFRTIGIALVGILVISSFHSHFSSGSVAMMFWMVVAVVLSTQDSLTMSVKNNYGRVS